MMHRTALDRLATLLFLGLISAPLQADDGADFQACMPLMQQGDQAGFAACIEKAQKKLLMGQPGTRGHAEELYQREAEHQQRAQQNDAQRQQQADVMRSRQAARRCIRDQSQARMDRSSQKRPQTFVFANQCDQPVYVELCAVDGPNRASEKARGWIPARGQNEFRLNLASAYGPPMTVTDFCFEQAQCRQAGGRDCAEDA